MDEENKLIAHRGIFDNASVVENTIEAFKTAIDLDIPIELDIQLTKDNEVVVFHDESISRLQGDDIVVQDVNYSQLRRYHLLDTTSHIPLLKDVLKLNNDKVLVDIEVKHTSRIKETVNTLMNELIPYEKYIIKSFDANIVRYIKKNYPKVTCGLLIKSKYKNFLYRKFIKTKIALKYTNCDFVSISKNLLKDSEFMELIKDMPKQIWTIDKKDEIKSNDKDIMYICNNLPYKHNLIDINRKKND